MLMCVCCFVVFRCCCRIDLQGGSAEALFDSVHKKLFTLPTNTAIYPAHEEQVITHSYTGRFTLEVLLGKLTFKSLFILKILMARSPQLDQS